MWPHASGLDPAFDCSYKQKAGLSYIKVRCPVWSARPPTPAPAAVPAAATAAAAAAATGPAGPDRHRRV